MLIIDSIKRIPIRSGERMKSKDMKIVRGMLESSEAIREFEKERRRGSGHITYSCIDLIMVLLWMEIKKSTLEGVVSDLTDAGGQQRLASLGLRPSKDGIIRCPSASTLCEFRKHVYPLFAQNLQYEIAFAFLASQREARFSSCDSTPLEASRYSKRCEYNPHYEIRMDKLHMITVNGMPITYRLTGGNCGDNPQLISMLQDLKSDNPDFYQGFLTDGAYHSFETYTEVFRKTGKVMSTNQGDDAAFHDEATWLKILDRYNRMWRNRDFKVVKHRTPRDILLYLANHGESRLVGRFLHNLDFFRGRATKVALSQKRHTCETVHFDAKRWMNLNVRGVHDKSVESVVSFRFLTIQLLSLTFESLDS